MRAVSLTNRGGRKNNEDHIAYANAESIWCFVLCDGLGGQKCGEVASEIVCNTICEEFKKQPELSDTAIREYARIAAEKLGYERNADVEKYNMSSTVVVLLTDGKKALYATLEQLEQWYRIFADDAEKYRESHRLEYKPDGKIVPHKPYAPYNDNSTDYEDMEFKPFESIDSIVKMSHCAQSAFAERIVRYFNRTYNVSVPVPQIDCETLTIGFRPEYTTYVDAVIEHLGGRSFRSTAEEELLKRFLDKVKPGHWSKTKPELKGNKIVFPDIVRFDDFYYSYGTNHIHYNYTNDIDRFCEGIVFAADDRLDGNKMAIIGFDCNNVDLNRWYELTTDNTAHMRFYKNGRIDVRFEDADSADRCYRKLRLDEIEIPVRI